MNKCWTCGHEFSEPDGGCCPCCGSDEYVWED